MSWLLMIPRVSTTSRLVLRFVCAGCALSYFNQHEEHLSQKQIKSVSVEAKRRRAVGDYAALAKGESVAVKRREHIVVIDD